MANGPSSSAGGPPLRWWELATQLHLELHRSRARGGLSRFLDFERLKVGTAEWWQHFETLALELKPECAKAVAYLLAQAPSLSPEPVVSLALALDQAVGYVVSEEKVPDLQGVS